MSKLQGIIVLFVIIVIVMTNAVKDDTILNSIGDSTDNVPVLFNGKYMGYYVIIGLSIFMMGFLFAFALQHWIQLCCKRRQQREIYKIVSDSEDSEYET